MWISGASAAVQSANLHHDKAVLRATLGNGLRVVIVRNTLAPVVTTEVNYLVGSNEAPPEFPGTAHAQEHMMFRGSKGLSADQLANISAAMGGMFDADTQQTVTQYYFTVPAKDLDVALHLQSIHMRGVIDDDKLWQKERQAIEQEVAQDLSNPQYVVYTKLLAAAFKGTPYARDALGTKASFDRTTGAMLRQFHDTWYAPNNAILVIVGNVDPAKTLATIRHLFGDIPAKKIPPRPDAHLQPMKAESLHISTDLPYGMAAFSFRMPGYDSSDYAAAQVLADVLSDERSDFCGLAASGKVLSTDFSMTPFSEASLAIATAGFPRGGNSSAALQQMRDVLTAYVRNGVPPDLVEAAKRSEVMGAELAKNSISGQANVWSNALAVEGRRSPDDDVEAIQRVTVADVNRVARRYIDLDHSLVAILTPQSSGKPVTAKGFGGKESFTPEHTTSVTLPSWAERATQRVSVPAATLHPVTTVLPNGLRLIVQPESISNTVSLYGHVRNTPDLEVPGGQEGVDRVLDRLFSYGTTSLDRIAFQKALDDIGANESAGADFGLQVLPADFERGVALLADNELHPALAGADFAIVQRQVAGEVTGDLQSPDYLTRKALRSALFPKKDPSLREPTPQSVSKLTLADVKAYYRHAFRPDLTTLVVIGKVTPEQARRVVEKYFGDWEAKGPRPETTLPPVPLNRPSIITVPNDSRVQDQVILGETLGLNRFHPDYYALKLGNHVLGSGFYATRLYRDLREDTGLVYEVGSTFQIGKSRGLYFVDYACDPPNVSKARVIVEQNLKEMQTSLVGAERFRQAKALTLREIPLSESSVDDIANEFVTLIDLGLPLNEPQIAARRYAALTPTEVRAAYARWIRVGDLVQVSEGPAPK